MKRDKRMRNISRVDSERKNQHGWLVRVMRQGVTHQKFFSDSVRGSESGSLVEAKRHRDELLRTYPKPEHGNMFNRKNVRNKSGYAGIHKTRSVSARGYTTDAWQAGWVLPDGTRVNRKFNFSLEGRTEEEALKLARRARREGMKEIARMRAAINERRERKRARKKNARK
jgi:hypothetical protein